MGILAILTDIEGTTSSIEFVHNTLFPYASRALPDFIRKHGDAHKELLDAVRDEAGEKDADQGRVIEILLGWIKEDRKATSLKALQGHIWTEGYKNGEFKGHVYEDAAEGLRRWYKAKFGLYAYSSGSVKSQKLLFSHSEAGDLTSLMSGYFDTTTGPKRDAESYRSIASAIGLPEDGILFLSDVAEELDAARKAGMRTIQLLRDDSVKVGNHDTAKSFETIFP